MMSIPICRVPTALASGVALLALLLLVPGCGRSDACSVETLDDGSVRISCDDGTEAIISPPGQPGSMGEAPEPCSVEQESDGSVVVSCPGADPVTIPAGPRGETGPPGEAGPGCTIQELDEGGARVVCADGTTVDLPDVPDVEGGCDLQREDGTLDLVCGEDSFRVAECGNGIREPGEACDAGEANGQGCTPAPGELSCEACTDECTVETVTFDPVRIEGLVLHANEGAIGAVPGARVRTSHGFEAISDGFGRYAIELPAGQPFTLLVDPVDVTRAALEFVSMPSQVPMRTAPWQRSFTAPEAGEPSLLQDIRLLSGERSEINTGGFDASTMAYIPLGSRSRGFVSGFFRYTLYSASVRLADLQLADGTRVPRGERLQATLVAYSRQDHSIHPHDSEGSFPWSGSLLTALPGDLPLADGRPVAAAMWVDLAVGGQRLHVAEGGTLGLRLVAPGSLMEAELEALFFDASTGEWEPAGDVRIDEAPGGEIALRFDTDRTGWYAIVSGDTPAERCITGTLTMGGAPVAAGVVGWSEFQASSSSSADDGSFCMPASGEDGELFSLLATALPADWDRHLGVATVELGGEGSCGTPTTCVDVGTIELLPMADGCLSVNLQGDELSRTRPLSVRYGLSTPGNIRRNWLAEPQWLVGHAPLAAARRVCAPSPFDIDREMILSSDLDPWCPAWDSIGWETDPGQPVVCEEDCADGDPDASAFFFCGS